MLDEDVTSNESTQYDSLDQTSIEYTQVSNSFITQIEDTEASMALSEGVTDRSSLAHVISTGQVVDFVGISQCTPQEGESLSQSQCNAAVFTERTFSLAESCKKPAIRASSKKRVLLGNGTGLFSKNSTLLDSHIALENKRCQDLGLPSPEYSFNHAMEVGSALSLNTNQILIVKTFFFAIASSQSLALLQDVVRGYRYAAANNLAKMEYDLSKANRLKEIEHLSETINYFSFLRRCHILQLFIDSSASNAQSSDGFVIKTTQSISTQIGTKVGNPRHLADADISKSIMNEVYPEMKEGATEYVRKYRHVSNLRKLGQRLHLLVLQFGYGILGLLPLANSADESIVSITDKMSVYLFSHFDDKTDLQRILLLPDAAFKKLVSILDQFQGHLLRNFGNAIHDVVDGIFRGTLDHSNSFAIENLKRTQIIQQPKGSPQLLSLLSRNPTPVHGHHQSIRTQDKDDCPQC